MSNERSESRGPTERSGLKDDPSQSIRPSERNGLEKSNCVIVTGLPGSGKTTCGKLLSKRLGYQFIDSDKLIEQSEGLPVREIFSQLGEPHFRSLESELLRLIENRLTASTNYIQTTGIEGSVATAILKAVKAKGLILSVGGGMPEPEENRERLKRIGTVVYLYSDPNEIAARLKQDGMRPLLSPNAKSNDAKVSVQIDSKNQTITSENISEQKISSTDSLVDNNYLETRKVTHDNQPGRSPDNAGTQLLHRLEELLDRRREAYECADIKIDTSGLTPHQIVNRLQEALKTHQQIL